MPYTLKTQQIAVKDPDTGAYSGVDILTEQTTEGLLTEIIATGNEVKTDVAAQMATERSDFNTYVTTKEAELDQYKSTTETNINTYVTNKNQEIATMIADADEDVSDLEDRKQDVADAVAGMLSKGVDNTLTTANVPAESKATGDLFETIVEGKATQPNDKWNRLWIKPSASDVEIPTMDEFDDLTTVLSSVDTVLNKNFNIEHKLLADGYSDDNNASVNMSNAPFVYNRVFAENFLITAIKLKVKKVGIISIGYYQGTPTNGDTYDFNKVVITNVITVSNTDVITVPLSNPFVVPANCVLLVGVNTDTARWAYGNYGNDKYFLYVNGGTGFKTSYSSVGLNIIGYTFSDINNEINTISSMLDVITDNVFEEGSVIDGYSDSNETLGSFSTSPYVIIKDIHSDCIINSAKINAASVGTITFGTIKKTDVEAEQSFDSTKLNIHQTIEISETGVQIVPINNMYVHDDEYVFYGISSNTATFYYGSSGNDKDFYYVSNNTYTLSTKSGNITLTGIKLTLAMSAKSVYNGKSLSILGDSISTFRGYIPEGNATYYPRETVTTVNDTWWKKLLDALGMELNVNNSWSGSRVTTTASEISAGCMTRCQNLGTNPDVIIVWMGINDFNNEVQLGTYDGTTSLPSDTTTFREAYAIMLNKILTQYQSSEIWVCTLPQCERSAGTGFPEINGNGVALAEFNKAIKELAEAFGVKVLEHNKCGLTYQNMPTFNPDNLHPNKYGHSLVANNDIRQMDNAVRKRY